MADLGDKARVEIEIAVRDMTSTAFKEVARNLDTINKKAMELGQGATGGMTKFIHANNQLNESAKRGSTEISKMSEIVTGLTEKLAGPVGIVAAFYSVSQSLQSFATSRVQLQMFSTDVGISTAKISLMRSTFADMGVSAEKADGYIAGLGGKLKDLSTYKFSSQTFRDLNDMVEGKWARKLLDVAESGDFDKFMKMIVAKGTTGTEAFREHFAAKMGVPRSVIQSWEDFEKKTTETYEAAYEHSQEYLRKMNRFESQLRSIFNRIMEFSITGLMGGEDVRTKGFEESLNELRRKSGKGGPLTPEGKNKSLFGRLNDWDWKSYSTPREKVENRFGDWPDEGMKARPFSDLKRADDLVNVSKDSNKVLLDMRDILQRMLGIGGGGRGILAGSGGAGIPGLPGGPVAPFAFGTGGGEGVTGGAGGAGGTGGTGGASRGPFRSGM